MVREQKKSKYPKPPPIPAAVKISFYLISACFLWLSLWSFHSDQPYIQNWIGLVGWSCSAFLLYCFGAASFLIPLHFLWLSILHIKKVPQGQIRKKACAFFMIPLCLAILLSMLSPIEILPAVLDSRLPKFHIGTNPPVAYLGGIPFYLLYAGQSLCLKHLIGSVGTAIITSFLLFFSVFYLFGGISLIKKKTLQNFFINKSTKYWNAFSALFKKLISKQSYLPKPSIRLSEHGSSPVLPFVSPHASPISIESLENFPPMNKAPAKHSSSLSEGAHFLAPHPCKRLLSNFINPQIPQEIKESKITPLPQPLLGQKSGSSPKIKNLVEGEIKLPQHYLLSKHKNVQPESLQAELQKKALTLKQTLTSFGIEADIGNICSGPSLAAFEVFPHTGVKVQKIKALEHDIALKLQASSVRIIAPIPGKAAVGIEIPTPFPQTVNFRDLLEDYSRHNQKLQIPLLLGKKANGDNLWADLATMPHLIIAGTTGSGKSVCINTIVMSIIMTSLPSDIKLVIVDPKKVELTGYSQLPHMLAPVITESKEVYNALMWLVKEMESRYEMLRFLGLRNIQAFNSRNKNEAVENSYDKEIPEKLPFLVGIIDELSDLLLSSSQDIETPIIRLAQMARAVGIHLILATQRPSREVITGLIKANFPSRIAFKVANKVNSQIIIDEPGAENLMGNGDMLLVSPSSFGATRAQGAYICDDDINKVIKDLCSRFPTQYIIPSFDVFDNVLSNDSEGEEKDPLFPQAKMLVIQTGNASTTFLQRKLKIGYARAASLMDQLEEARVIGPSEGAKPRQVLMQSPQEG